MHGLISTLVVVSSFVIAVYYTFKLVRETKYERYWIFFFISAVFMGIHHIAVIPFNSGLISEHNFHTLEDIGEIVGALALAYAAYGISKSMREVRKRFPQE